MKIETLFSKLKADFGLVDSLTNFLTKMCTSNYKNLSSERKGKRGPSKGMMKRTKSEKLHAKNMDQVS